ncbi:hypothetical protein HYW55_00440 [Candidatus Gottesmanbacteria bacterium]|nr:hypothetical protein [Candidatus Gottesmanbacteria bacterium]
MFALMAGVAYGGYTFLISRSAKTGITTSFGAAVLQVTAAVEGIAVVLFLYVTGQPIHVTTHGVVLAILAGLAVGTAEILSFIAYSRGLSVAVGTQITVGLSILIPVILGVVIAKESIQPIQIVAFVLIAIGVVVLLK